MFMIYSCYHYLPLLDKEKLLKNPLKLLYKLENRFYKTSKIYKPIFYRYNHSYLILSIYFTNSRS